MHQELPGTESMRNFKVILKTLPQSMVSSMVSLGGIASAVVGPISGGPNGQQKNNNIAAPVGPQLKMSNFKKAGGSVASGGSIQPSMHITQTSIPH